jgi:hypothetical protein
LLSQQAYYVSGITVNDGIEDAIWTNKEELFTITGFSDRLYSPFCDHVFELSLNIDSFGNIDNFKPRYSHCGSGIGQPIFTTQSISHPSEFFV